MMRSIKNSREVKGFFIIEKMNFAGEDDMEETTGQIPNVAQQLDGSTDAEESQRLVSVLYV